MPETPVSILVSASDPDAHATAMLLNTRAVSSESELSSNQSPSCWIRARLEGGCTDDNVLPSMRIGCTVLWLRVNQITFPAVQLFVRRQRSRHTNRLEGGRRGIRGPLSSLLCAVSVLSSFETAEVVLSATEVVLSAAEVVMSATEDFLSPEVVLLTAEILLSAAEVNLSTR
eukprot:156789-Rhodomonas_salina.1